MSATLRYRWDGDPTHVRSTVRRGSAAGSAFAGILSHRMNGYDNRMAAVTLCGLTVQSAVLSARRPNPRDLPLCPLCWQPT